MQYTGMCPVYNTVGGNNSLSVLSLLFFAAANSSATPSASFTLSTTVVKGDVVVHCVSCSRDMRAGAYEEHECVLTLAASEERAAAGLLKRAISTSSKGIIQLGTGGTVSVFNVNNTQCLPLML